MKKYITEVRWTKLAKRQFAEWVAAFHRDQFSFHVFLAEFAEMVENVIYDSHGYPEGSRRWGPANAEIVEWEFVSRELWITHSVRKAPTRSFWRWLTGRPRFDAVVITSLRRPQTPQERSTLETNTRDRDSERDE